MSLDQNEIKKLLEGVELEDGAIKGLTTILEKGLNEKVEAMKADEAKKLEEATASVTAKDAEIASLKEQMATLVEKADEYGKVCADEARAEVSALAEDYGKYVQQETAERLNEYAKYAASEFIKENKEKFVELDEYNRMKTVFETVKTSFEANGFPVNDEIALTEAKKEAASNKEAGNALFAQLQETKKELEVAQQALVFNEMTANLTDTQKERITSLSENVKFNGMDEFRSAMKFMVETVTKNRDTAVKPAITESREVVEPSKTSSSLIEQTLKVL